MQVGLRTHRMSHGAVYRLQAQITAIDAEGHRFQNKALRSFAMTAHCPRNRKIVLVKSKNQWRGPIRTTINSIVSLDADLQVGLTTDADAVAAVLGHFTHESLKHSEDNTCEGCCGGISSETAVKGCRQVTLLHTSREDAACTRCRIRGQECSVARNGWSSPCLSVEHVLVYTLGGAEDQRAALAARRASRKSSANSSQSSRRVGNFDYGTKQRHAGGHTSSYWRD